MPRPLCARLRREIARQLASSARPELGGIHSEGKRLDLPLRLTDPVAETLLVIVDRLGDTLKILLGPDARLVELSALQSLPGAACQPPHPDAGRTDDPDESRLLTVFVPLVDVTEAHGPLEVWPGSHAVDPDAVDPEFWESVRLTSSAGVAILMDARTWHRGTANTAADPRPVFYASWLSPGTPPDGPTWSLHPRVPESLTPFALSRPA